TRFDGFAVAAVTVEPGGRVTVVLSAAVPLMLAGELTSGLAPFQVTARATAVVPLGRPPRHGPNEPGRTVSRTRWCRPASRRPAPRRRTATRPAGCRPRR